MLGGADPLEDHRQDPGRIAADQRGRVEPEAGEDLAAEDAVGPRLEALVLPSSQDEPVDRAVEDPPDDVFRTSLRR